MTTYAIRTEGAALNFYNAIMALAQTATVFNDYVDGRKVNPSVDAELIRVKHNTQYFSIRFSRGRLIDFAASILKNWEAFGGGAKPAREKKARSAWPARALSVLKSCFEDGDLSAVRRIALDELGGFVAGREIVDAEGVARSITTILVSPEPVEGWEDVGIVVAYNIAAKQWAVMHQASGIGCGGSARTKKAALDAFNATIERVGEASARDKMSAAGSNPYTAADWDAEHLHLSPAVDATVAQAAAEDAQSVAAPEVQSAPAAAVDSLYNPGTPDPKNSAALPELDGFRPGDVVDVSCRTIGRSTIELVFNRKLAGFDAQPMARIVGASGKRLDVQLFQLTRVEAAAPEPESEAESAQDTAPAPAQEAPAAPAEVQAPHVAASPEVSPPCGDIAPAAQDVTESKAAAPVELEAAEGAAAPAEPAPMTAEEPAKATASPEFAALMAQARQARQMARDAVARAQASARDTRPPEPRTPQAPAASIRFMQHYVTDGTSKAKCRYYASDTREGRAFVDVDAVSYGAQLRPIFGAAVRNDTDTMTDYFCKDSVRIFSDSPLYPAALARAKANDAKRQERHEKRQAKRKERSGC